MFFFNRKKSKPSSKGLPEKLEKLKQVNDIVWVWDPDYKMLVWANEQGMAFWDARSRIELKELIFPATHPLMQVSSTAMRALKRNKTFSKELLLRTHPDNILFLCIFEAQTLPDGRNGLLVTIPEDHKDGIIQNFEIKQDKIDIDALSNLDDLYDDDDKTLVELEEQEESITTVTETEETPSSQESEETILDSDQEISAEKTLTFSALVHSGQFMGADDAATELLKVDGNCYFPQLCASESEGNDILHMLQDHKHVHRPLILRVDEHDMHFILDAKAFQHDGKQVFNGTLLPISQEDYEAVHAQNEDNDDDTELSTEELEDISDTETLSLEDISGKSENDRIIAEADDKDMPSSGSILNMLDITSIGVFIIDSAGKIIDVNGFGQKMIGLYKEDLADRTIASLFDQEAAEIIKATLETPEQHLIDLSQGVACRYHGVDNALCHGQLIIRIHPDKADHYWVLLSDQTDISEIKKEIANLKTASDTLQENKPTLAANDTPQKQEQKQDKLVTDFVAHISHELRAPLGAIAGYAELLDSEVFGPIDAGYKDYITSLNVAVAHARDIIDDLLDFSKLEAGAFIPQPEITDLRDIIDEAVLMVTPAAKFNQITLSSRLLSGTPNITIDGRLLKQVLINLLSNAVKYSEAEQSVTITAGQTKTGRIMIEVVNFGETLTAEQLENIVKPYTRLSKTEKIQGTGLGLPIAKQLTEVLGGHFILTSENNRTRARLIFESI
ncbi:MAG: PAS domain-containing sensor histidine kinase [Pseudomonadota bacterium]